LRNRDLAFAVSRELRPVISNAPIDFDPILLQHVQQTRAPDSFRRRPDKDERVFGPPLLAPRVTETAVQLEERLTILPERNGPAELATFREVLVENRREPIV
jgi:hypothetical protein